MTYTAEPRARRGVVWVAMLVALAVVATLFRAPTPVQAVGHGDPCADIVVRGPDGRPASARPQTVAQVFSGPVCQLEQKILQDLADERGIELTQGERERLLSWGRDEVRARLFLELLRIIGTPKAERSSIEQDAVDWLLARVISLRIEMAEAAHDEYLAWQEDPCTWAPPAGFPEYNPGAACSDFFLTKFFSGAPLPPTYEEFVQYGVVSALRRFEQGAAAAVAARTASALEGVAITSGILAGASAATVIAVKTAAALGATMAAIFPHTFYVPTVGIVAPAVSLGGLAGPIAIVLIAIVIAVVRGVQVFEALWVQTELQGDMNEAREVFDLAEYIDSEENIAVLFAAFLEATLPDYPAPAHGPAAPVEPTLSTPGFLIEGAGDPLHFSTVLEYFDHEGNEHRAWIDKGWWVIDPVDPEAGPNRLDRRLTYVDPQLVVNTAAIADDGFVVLNVSNDVPKHDCPSALCQLTTTLTYLGPGPSDPDAPQRVARTARLVGVPDHGLVGPFITGQLQEGATVTLGADADVDAIYHWEVSHPSFSEPGETIISRYSGQEVTHTFRFGGPHKIEVFATDELGATTFASLNVNVAFEPLELQLKQLVLRDIFVGWEPGAFSEGKASSSAVEITAGTGAQVSIDWNLDGVYDETKSTGEFTTASFALPVAYPDDGEYAVRVRAARGDQTTVAVFGIEVLNAPPHPVDLELWVDGEWIESPLRQHIPSFFEGDTVRARYRVSDPGQSDVLDAHLRWSDGTYQVFKAVTREVWHEVTHKFANVAILPPLGLTVVAFDDAGARTRGDDVGLAYFGVHNVSPTVSNIAATVAPDGTVTLSANYSDPAFADASQVTIDWGDDSGVETLGLPQWLPTGTGNMLQLSFNKFVATHNYSAPGPYTISFRVLDDVPQSAPTHTVSVDVNGRPVIHGITEMEFAPEGQASRIAMMVSDPDHATEDLEVEIVWGDGHITPAIYDPDEDRFWGEHVFADDGFYLMTIRARDPLGLGAVPIHGFAEIANVPPVLEALELDEQGVEGIPVTLSGRASDVEADVADRLDVHIDWGDGTDETIKARFDDGTFTRTHTYRDDGEYTVTVVVSDGDGGETEPEQRTVMIANVDPVIDAVVIPSSVDEGDVVTVFGLVSDAGADDVLTVYVDWGDGTTASMTAFASGDFFFDHAYADDGQYTVRVDVSDDDGGQGEQEAGTIVVANVAPTIVSATVGPSPADEGSQVTVTGSVFDPGTADVVEVTIDWGDGTEDTVIAGQDRAYESNHAYGDDGVYEITITAVDDDGGESESVERSVSVLNVAPVITGISVTDELGGELSSSIGVLVGLPVSVTIAFTDPGWLDTHTFEFDWGDGSTTGPGESATERHTYETAGEYIASFRVEDDDGDSDETSVTIRVFTPTSAVEWAIETIEDTSLPRAATKSVKKALQQLDGPGTGDALGALAEDDLATAATKIRNAVKELLTAEKHGAEVGAAIDVLVLTLKSIALDVVTTAEAEDPDTRELAKAREKVAAGDAALAAGDLAAAAAAYCDAITRLVG